MTENCGWKGIARTIDSLYSNVVRMYIGAPDCAIVERKEYNAVL
jgi:hypothetical protein